MSQDPVVSLIRKVFKLGDQITLDDSMGQGQIPGWDSLGALRLVDAVEAELGVAFDLDEIASLSSIGDLRRILGKRIKDG